jgi:hypothetical protein
MTTVPANTPAKKIDDLIKEIREATSPSTYWWMQMDDCLKSLAETYDPSEISDLRLCIQNAITGAIKKTNKTVKVAIPLTLKNFAILLSQLNRRQIVSRYTSKL